MVQGFETSRYLGDSFDADTRIRSCHLSQIVSTSVYLLFICGGAIVLCFAPTLTILALASRAFAFYYFPQCLVAASLARSASQRVFFRLMAFILAMITLFAVPAG